MEASVSRYLGIRACAGPALLACGALLLSGCFQDWDRLSRPDVGFEVSMPGTITCGGERRTVLDGRVTVWQVCASEASSHVRREPAEAKFEVAWSEPGAVAQEAWGTGAAEDLCRIVEPSVPPRVWSSEPLGGVQGVECLWDEPLSSGAPEGGQARHRFVSRARCVRHGGRLLYVRITGVLDFHLERLWEQTVASLRFLDAARDSGARGN
jgi:hypothetical protein